MKGKEKILRFLCQKLESGGEAVPGLPLVEIYRDSRVLIENHRGVCKYSREEIVVTVSFGQVSICGCDLELARMTCSQLVISGRIDAVCLLRRERD